MSGNKNIKHKIVIWKCECTNCGDKGSVEVPQELTPGYCTQCGSKVDYQEVAGYEVDENKKTPQDVLDQGDREEISKPKAETTIRQLAELGINLSGLL